MTEGASDHLWAEAMSHACGMSNRCVTNSLDRGKTPYELWHGHPPAISTLQQFGTVSYLHVERLAHKLAACGANCTLLGTAGPHDINGHCPRGTFRVRDLITGAIIWRQVITWRPAAGTGGTRPSPRSLGGGATRSIHRNSRTKRQARGQKSS